MAWQFAKRPVHVGQAHTPALHAQVSTVTTTATPTAITAGPRGSRPRLLREPPAEPPRLTAAGAAAATAIEAAGFSHAPWR